MGWVSIALKLLRRSLSRYNILSLVASFTEGSSIVWFSKCCFNCRVCKSSLSTRTRCPWSWRLTPRGGDRVRPDSFPVSWSAKMSPWWPWPGMRWRQFLEVSTCTNQCCGSWFLSIPDPGSYNSTKIGGEKFFFSPTIFSSHKYHKIVNNFYFWTGYFLTETLRVIVLYFLPKNLSLSCPKYGFGIREIRGPRKTYSGSGIQCQKGNGSRIRIRNTATNTIPYN